jgi:hypothetical protein
MSMMAVGRSIDAPGSSGVCNKPPGREMSI